MHVVTPSPLARRSRHSENAERDNNAVVSPALEPDNGGGLQNHQQGEPVIDLIAPGVPVVEEENQEEIEKENDAERIYQILANELGLEDADADADLLNELGLLMSKTKKTKEVLESNAKYLIEIEGHHMILLALRAHQYSSRVQQEGIMAITRLVSRIGVGLQDDLASAGAIELVVTSMERFPSDLVTVTGGCGMLVYLAYGHIHVKQQILHGGGIARICLAMESFPYCMNIQRCGCHALFYLYKGLPDETKEAILEANGVASIEAALENFRDDKKIKKSAEKLLEALLG